MGPMFMCRTKIRFSGGETAEFASFIKEALSEDRYPNDWGKDWLGNIPLYAGADEDDFRLDAGDDKARFVASRFRLCEEDDFRDVDDYIRSRYYCRGVVSEMDDSALKDNVFYLNTQTTWVPMIGMFKDVMEMKGFKGITIDYYADEPVYDILEATDYYSPSWDYTVACHTLDWRFEKLCGYRHSEYWNEADLLKELQYIYGNKDINECIALAENEDFLCYVYEDQDFDHGDCIRIRKIKKLESIKA